MTQDLPLSKSQASINVSSMSLKFVIVKFIKTCDKRKEYTEIFKIKNNC